MSGINTPVRSQRRARENVAFVDGLDFKAATGRPYPGTFKRASVAWLGNVPYPTDMLRLIDYPGGKIALIEGAATNLIKNSAMTAAETVALSAQPYALSMKGSGTLTLSGVATGTVTASTPRVFTPSSGNLTITPSGEVLHAQLEVGRFPTSRIPTNGAAVTRATEAWDVPGVAPLLGRRRPWTLALAVRDLDATVDAASGTFGHRDVFGFGVGATDNDMFRMTGFSVGSRTMWSSVGATRTDWPGPSLNVSATAFVIYHLVYDGQNMTVYQDGAALATWTAPNIPNPSLVRLGGRGGFAAGHSVAYAYLAPGAPGLGIPFLRPFTLTAAQVAAESARWAPVLGAVTLPDTAPVAAPNPVPVTPPAAVQWEAWNEAEWSNSSLPTTITGRNFKNDDTTRSLIRQWPRRFHFVQCRFDSITAVLGGFGLNATFEDCSLTTRRPTVYGQSAPYLMSGKEFRHLRMDRCDVPFLGKGINLTGYSSNNPKAGTFAGDWTAGDGLYIYRSRFRNPDGRRSNGAGGYIKSHVGLAHYNNNMDGIRDIGGVVGFDIANWIQMNAAPGVPIDLIWNEILCDLDLSRVEDVLSFFGGSGGRAERRGVIANNLLENSGGADWRYQAGVSSSYHVGNQLTEADGADGPQIPSKVVYSGTSILNGDEGGDLYERNTSYLTFEGNVGIGARPILSMLRGHHNIMKGNSLYDLDRHRSGVLYAGYHDAYYQIANWDGTRTARDANGADTGVQVWGFNDMLDNVAYRRNTSTETPMGTFAAIADNGGTQSGNVNRPRPLDGGAAALAAWRAAANTANGSIGRQTDRESLS